jgi:hypothetical protein
VERLLALQAKLQEESYGYDVTQLNLEQLVHYVRWNVLAAEDELHEMLGEVSWKPWAKNLFVRREAALRELIDAYHFLNNLWLAIAALPPDESADLLHEMYEEKHEKNADRMRTGYDGVTGKCPHCRRDLGDADVQEAITADGIKVRYCTCGFVLERIEPQHG